MALLCSQDVAGWSRLALPHLVLVKEMPTEGNKQSAAMLYCQLCLTLSRPRSGDTASCTNGLELRNGQRSLRYCTAKFMPAERPILVGQKELPTQAAALRGIPSSAEQLRPCRWSRSSLKFVTKKCA